MDKGTNGRVMNAQWGVLERVRRDLSARKDCPLEVASAAVSEALKTLAPGELKVAALVTLLKGDHLVERLRGLWGFCSLDVVDVKTMSWFCQQKSKLLRHDVAAM